jgi:signal transduction histidine kinase
MHALENRFFADFSEEGKEALLPHLKVEGYPAGNYLFHEGDQADGVCLVVEGDIEILKAAGTREQILAVFHAGDFMGEAAVLDEKGRSTCARARSDAVIVKIPAEPLLAVLSREPVSVTLKLFQQVLTYFRRTNNLFVHEVIHKEKLALVGEMAGSLMHDLRNPLSGIRMAADFLALVHQDEESTRCYDNIRIQCDRVAAMATDLLEVSRGEVKLHLRRTDTDAFIQQFQVLNAEYLRHTGLEIVFNTEPGEIEVDPIRVQRLVQNLVTNAVEAIGPAAGGRIEIGARIEDSHLQLSVKDNGPGLPQIVIDHMFKPFSTFGKSGGTGLGMAIVKNVVDAHHGTISYETTPGEGTSFLIRLPQLSTPPHIHVADAEGSEVPPEAVANLIPDTFRPETA